MADAPGNDAISLSLLGKVLALLSVVAGWKFWSKGKKVNEHSRAMVRLENILKDLRQEVSALDEKWTEMEGMPERVRRLEVGARDTRRELRDSLSEIQETMGRVSETVERTLQRIDRAAGD